MVNALRGGHDRRGDGRGGGLVHGAAPSELRRAHAVDDVVPGRRAAPRWSGCRCAWATTCSARAARARDRPLGSRRAAAQRSAAAQESAAIGVVQALALALGFLFLSLYGGVLEELETLLFGSFLGIIDGQVLTLLVGRRGACWRCSRSSGRPLLFASVDGRGARARRAGARAVGRLPACCSAWRSRRPPDHRGRCWCSRCSWRPPAAAQLLTARSALSLALSVAFALAGDVAGTGDRLLLDLPVGFFVTTLAFGVYVLARAT